MSAFSVRSLSCSSWHVLHIPVPGSSARREGSDPKTDLVVVFRIYTADTAQPNAEALVVQEGRSRICRESS